MTDSGNGGTTPGHADGDQGDDRGEDSGKDDGRGARKGNEKRKKGGKGTPASKAGGKPAGEVGATGKAPGQGAGDGKLAAEGEPGAEGKGGAPWPLAVILGVCSGVIVTVAMKHVYAFAWLSTLVTAAVTLVAIVLLGWLITRPPVMEALKRLVGGLPAKAVTAVCWTAAGAAAMALALVAGVAVHRPLERTGSCGQPLELRVLTTPETLTPLRAAAAEFENDSEDDGCRKYGVTVVPETEPVQLSEAFGRLWRSSEASRPQASDERLFGPQPDIWVPSSTAEFGFVPKSRDQVRTVAGTGRAGAPPATDADPVFVRHGSLGSSPLVLALFTKAHEAVSDPIAPWMHSSVADVLRRAEEARVRLRAIARPVPETSATSLAVTPALYAALPGGDRADERFIRGAGVVAPDAVTLLCRFREMAASGNAEPPTHIAVAVPEQLLHDYDMGRPLGDDIGRPPGQGGERSAGDRCGRVEDDGAQNSEWLLHPYYSADMPTFDYPFVQVIWRGQDTEERDAAVREFRRWLDDNPLTLQGFRGERGIMPTAREGDREHWYLSRLRGIVGRHVVPHTVAPRRPEELQKTLQRVGAARPNMSVSLMLDVSGSMGGAAKAHDGSRLSLGVSFLQSIVAQLQSNDRVGLQVSSSTMRPDDRSPLGTVPDDVASREHKNLLTGTLQALATSGGDHPLIDTIAAGDLGSGRPNLILVTDGQVPSTNPDLRARARWLSGEFRDDHPGLRLTVVLTGPATCGSAPVKQVVDALDPGDGARCVELTAAPEAEQAAGLLAELR